MNKVAKIGSVVSLFLIAASALAISSLPVRAAEQAAPAKAAPGIVYEAEAGVMAGGTVLNDDAAASGGKAVGSFHVSGASDTINKVDGGKGGAYNIVVRYCTPDDTSNSLYVNDVKVGSIDYKGTGSWGGEGAYKEKTVAVTLKAGTVNVIKFQTDDGNGAINIDKITVSPAPPPAPAK